MNEVCPYHPPQPLYECEECIRWAEMAWELREGEEVR